MIISFDEFFDKRVNGAWFFKRGPAQLSSIWSRDHSKNVSKYMKKGNFFIKIDKYLHNLAFFHKKSMNISDFL